MAMLSGLIHSFLVLDMNVQRLLGRKRADKRKLQQHLKKKRRGSGSQAVNSGEGRDRGKIGYQIDRKRIIVFLQGLVIHEPSFLYEIRPKERVALAEQSKVAH